MAARTVVRDGHKFCSSHCGRWLPVDAFFVTAKGKVNSECKDCGRVRSREWWRRTSPTYQRRKHLGQMKAWRQRRAAA